MSFRFNQGDRPLPGYTIQRGVGRGGFGEVYYALSDGGKEVALKYLRENPQVELRGAAHCLNLKSPYLVALHDIKENTDGDFFVIMEYVGGPSLRDLMNTEPAGLGTQKAAYFLREIAKGLAYLHDRGIVHRDLKPGNIFYDEGYVKIGDYGLSKIMAASQHSGQTVSVGTVHYMAPEVGSGNYDRTIDIYALGVILYEMLLGRVPFSGATMGEVLMKHLTAQPELEELLEPFPRVIRKALEKDPGNRYQTVNEMVGDLFSVDELDRSVASFEPASLSSLAARVAVRINVGAPTVTAARGRPSPSPLGTGSSNAGQHLPPPVIDPAAVQAAAPAAVAVAEAIEPAGGEPGRPIGRIERLHERISTRVDQVAQRIDRTAIGRQVAQAVHRPGHIFEQVVITLLTVVGLSWAYAVVAGHSPSQPVGVLFHTLAVVQGVAVGSWLSLSRWKMVGKWGPRVIVAVFVGAGLLPAYGIGEAMHVRDVENWSRALILSALLCDWPGRFQQGRRGKASLGAAFSVGLFGFIVSAVTDVDEPLAVAVICAISSLAVQAIANIWPLGAEPPPIPEQGSGEAVASGVAGVKISDAAPGVAVNPPSDRFGAVPAGVGAAPAAARAVAMPVAPDAASLAPPRIRRSVVVRAMWVVLAAALLCASIMSYASTGILRLDGDEFAASIIGGIAGSSYFFFALSCALRRFKAGWWRTVFRPAIFFTGLAAGGGAGAAIGLLGWEEERLMVGLGIILAGAIMSLFVWFVPVPAYVPKPLTALEDEETTRRRRGGRLMAIGCVFYVIALAALVFVLVIAPEDLVNAGPVVLLPLVALGTTFVIVGAIGTRSKRPKREKAALPLRRVFEVDATTNLSSLIQRHMTVLGYTLASKSDLMWSFVRGDWTAQWWQEDIRRWKTQANIAAYELEGGVYRVTCYLNVDAPFNSPSQKMIAVLESELRELQTLLGGREAPLVASEAAV